MTREELRQHIDAAAPGGAVGSVRLTALIVNACWPGGPADHTDRTSLEWLRHWHPEEITAQLPECSCATGRCVLCN